MALTRTSLAAACGPTDLIVNVTSATGATVNGIIKIDDEYGLITAINGTAITIRRRGNFGGQALAHTVLAPVTFGLTSDLPIQNGPREWVQEPSQREELVNIGADGAIPLPVRDTTFFINKATALATSTLPNPTAAQDGLLVTFVSNTNAAHVVTLVNSQDGTTGNHTTYTFPAFGGSSFTVIACGGRWLVKSNNLVVIT